jgi:hypothetical protein
VDSSKEYSMEVMVYHVNWNPEPTMVDSDVPEGYDENDSPPTA